MELRTERLVIREFMPEDGEDLYDYLSDPEVVKYEPYGVCDRESAYAQAAWRAVQPDFFAVELADTGKLIGNLYLGRRDFDAFELGYVFNRAYWHQGFAKESASALLDWAFNEQNAHRCYAECNPENENSWHLLENLGFRREAHLHLNIFFERDRGGDPIWQDTYVYAILRDEWVENRQ